MEKSPGLKLFPYKYLVQAYNILEGQGHDAFRRFVNSIKMPVEDIERVLNRYAYQTNPEFKVKIDKMMKRIKDKMKNWAGPSQRHG